MTEELHRPTLGSVLDGDVARAVEGRELRAERPSVARQIGSVTLLESPGDDDHVMRWIVRRSREEPRLQRTGYTGLAPGQVAESQLLDVARALTVAGIIGATEEVDRRSHARYSVSCGGTVPPGRRDRYRAVPGRVEVRIAEVQHAQVILGLLCGVQPAVVEELVLDGIESAGLVVSREGRLPEALPPTLKGVLGGYVRGRRACDSDHHRQHEYDGHQQRPSVLAYAHNAVSPSCTPSVNP